MIEKPGYVKNFDRPRGTEIKHINGHWYLYERLSVYDPVAKKKRKKSEKILGSITPEGFAPSKRQSPLGSVDPADVENRELGATALLYTSRSGCGRALRRSSRIAGKRSMPSPWPSAGTTRR